MRLWCSIISAVDDSILSFKLLYSVSAHMKSFIIEDSRLARLELKRMLKSHSDIQLCGEAENPLEALPLINRERPDLLFLDINMPGKSGFELLREIEYEPKIIFITAYAERKT